MTGKLWLTLLLVLTPMTSQAGIRVIYGGGGYGEMQALSALDQLNAFVEPIVFVEGWTRTPYPLLSNLNEARMLRYLWRDGIFKTADLVVEFAAPSAEAGGQANLRIDPAVLYQTDGTPKSFADIFVEVFVARLTAKDALPYLEWADVTSEGARNLARELNSKFEVFSARAGNDDFMVDFTGVRLKDGGTGMHVGARWVQDGAVTLLGIPLADALPCELPGPRTVSKVTDLHVEDGRIYGRIEWTCGGRQNARGRISITPQAKGEAPLLKITQAEFLKYACDAELTRQ